MVLGGCGTFYAISIEHSSFKGLSTIKQHRLVNGLLSEEIKGMHGLQVSAFETKAPHSQMSDESPHLAASLCLVEDIRSCRIVRSRAIEKFESLSWNSSKGCC